MDSLDISLLILRSACGASIAYHGYNKVFGAGGLSGTASWFGSIGMKWPKLQARMAAGTEIVAGLLLVIGFLTPLAGAAIVALMIVAIVTVHGKVGYFIFLPNGGWEYTALIAVVGVSLSLSGPGRISIDHLLGMSPELSLSLGAIALGMTGAFCHLVISFRRPT